MSETLSASQIIKNLNERGISRYKIWWETGIDQGTLSRWYHKKTNPDKDKIKKLINFYNEVK